MLYCFFCNFTDQLSPDFHMLIFCILEHTKQWYQVFDNHKMHILPVNNCPVLFCFKYLYSPAYFKLWTCPHNFPVPPPHEKVGIVLNKINRKLREYYKKEENAFLYNQNVVNDCNRDRYRSHKVPQEDSGPLQRPFENNSTGPPGPHTHRKGPGYAAARKQMLTIV